MSISLFDLFKIGIGPSSSHTMGPMIAAGRFAQGLISRGVDKRMTGLRAHLFGSLAMTGIGHGTDKAVVLGFAGEKPDKVDPDVAEATFVRVRSTGRLPFLGSQELAFDATKDIEFHFGESLELHSNGMRFEAVDASGGVIFEEVYYSVGGGFVLSDQEAHDQAANEGNPSGLAPGSNLIQPFPFNSAQDLLEVSKASGKSIAEIALANEEAWRSPDEINTGIHEIWRAMDSCIERGCRETGVLPGGLQVKRRAKEMRDDLVNHPEASLRDQLSVMDWVNLYALAVNEENAAGGKVVTAPTNGAAGVIPAVLAYYVRFVPGANDDGVVTFLATSGAIGMLYKKNASISAAEVGCQGEVGVACSMAAAGLCAVLGGNVGQVENAAEIGMEHNLGLTCDPVGGLVQIPCIERNTMGAVKAINAARLALRGDGNHSISLDKVIRTMRETGRDMNNKYKETSEGGLAVNIVAC